MNLNRYRNVTWPLAALVVLTGTAMAAPAVSGPASSGTEREAARLLRNIRMDARQVRAHAWQWAMLTDNQITTWYKFDQQWKQIQPPVADMNVRLARLENMSAGLPAWERGAVADSKPLIAAMTGETQALKAQLDTSYTDLSNLSNPALRIDSKALAKDAGRLVRTVERPGTAQ